MTRMEWDDNERKEIDRIRTETGIKNTPEIVRFALKSLHKNLTGTPGPNSESK